MSSTPSGRPVDEELDAATPTSSEARAVTVPEVAPLLGEVMARIVGGVAGVLFISTETSLDARLATARSSLPSLLKAPTAPEAGPLPAPKGSAGWQVPSPFPSSTEMSLDP